MDTVSERSTGSSINFGGVPGGLLNLIKAYEETSKNQVKAEEELNKLKTSNVLKLGLLKSKQEKELMDSILEAEKKLIDARAERMKLAAEEEARARYKQLTAMEDDLSDERKAAITKQVTEEYKTKIQQIDDLVAYEYNERDKNNKKELKEAKKQRKKKQQEEFKENVKNAFDLTKVVDLKDRGEAFKELFAGPTHYKTKDGEKKELTGFGKFGANLLNGFNTMANVLSDFAQKYEKQMDEIASKKSAIDTRLQGSNNTTRYGSYWDQMTRDITGFAGVSPLIKQSAVADRVASLVSQGISFNVEQRATLDVLKDKIATTFDAANGTLLRLVRIQQQDTTAGRLGMESALTAFLNNMYETTEYMQGLANTVKSNLEEAMSLMTGENALSFEYQIQKWLGSLSSVGMSESAVSGLAGILGQVAAGKLDGITGGGQGNLVIMAANQAGLNMSDILNKGLDETTTNALMNSMVDYLAKIYSDAGNSKVIQQQIASVYGLSASDLKAAVNLSKSQKVVAKEGLDYNSAMGRLYSMAGTMGSRTSLGEQLSNMWDNFNYTMAAGMSNNPVTYALYKVGGLLEKVAGDGLNFSIPLVMGNGSTMEFDIPNLLRAGAMAGGIMSGIGSMVSTGGGGGLFGESILRGIGLTRGGSAQNVVTRGTGLGLATMSGATVSESGSMVGNSSGDDVTNKTMTDKTDSAKQETASAVDESDETKLKDVDNHVVTIIEILRSISEGNSILKVAVDGDVRIASESITQMGL